MTEIMAPKRIGHNPGDLPASPGYPHQDQRVHQDL